ncbi:3'-5' exonuclease [Pelagicoccus mobilis]|uniref:3'-5' exonuclease n=1 Tax=Pelagicoccus mobilis TaxID=415221 RepID=A0A934RXL8_9BACT|nr:3'-5' exonuclease [Pelagicoccus mobilis]MBK1877094.1 3'-5' exonuclease [Pelagicoccus mobilis]
MKPLQTLRQNAMHPLMGIGEVVAFDLETTGLRYKEEQITQIAAIRMGGCLMEIDDTFDTYVDPGKAIPEHIQELTHIRDEHVIGAPKPIEGLREFSRFVENATLFGHDIYRFDCKFIEKAMKTSEEPARTVQFIDTMDIFEQLWPDFSRLRNSLDDIAERLSAGLSSIRRHDAKGDAILLAHIFQRIQNHPDLEKLCSRVPVHECQLPQVIVPSERTFRGRFHQPAHLVEHF